MEKKSAAPEPALEERTLVGGHVVYFEPPRPPSVLAAEGAALAGSASDFSPSEAEAIYREAIERFVDAFLLARRPQRDCFTEAHRIGRMVDSTYGCPLRSDDGGAHWGTACGVLALHSRLGWSYGAITRGRCSICGAGDLACEHIPGHAYGERICVREVYDVDLDEVSLTPFPDDPRCYRTIMLRPLADIERSVGRAMGPGETPHCAHCSECPGADQGPREEDLDPGLWPVPAGDSSPG